jgi:hypothetical protein
MEWRYSFTHSWHPTAIFMTQPHSAQGKAEVNVNNRQEGSQSQCVCSGGEDLVPMTSVIFWDITQRVVEIPYQSFGTTYRSRLGPSRWVRYVVPKRRLRITTTYCVISKKSADLVYYAAKSWNKTCRYLGLTSPPDAPIMHPVSKSLHRVTLYGCDMVYCGRKRQVNEVTATKAAR